MATDDKEYDLNTEEGQRAYVMDTVRKGFADPTKESKQRARSSLLEAYDDATSQHLNEAEEYGAEIGDMKLTVELRFDKELGVWGIERLQARYPTNLPRFPIKRIYGLYSVDDKFWEEGDNEDKG